MAWSWVAAQLSGMVAGEFKQLNTNDFFDVALARTRANFDAGSTWANDAAVLSAVKAANNTNMCAFSGPAINHDTGEVKFCGGGHADSGDGSIFDFSPATSFAWTLEKKSPMIDSAGAHTVTAGITAITAGTPPRLTVDADVMLDGDQGVITGTTDANGTYQLVRVDATHVDLYNIDGTYSAKYTAFSGGSLTDSTGTLTITVGTNSVDGSSYYAHPNADGEEMPPAAHTYHWKWIGDDRYLLSGQYIFDGGTGGQSQRRIWVYDAGAVYRSLHDPRGSTSNGNNDTGAGGPWGNGPYAYDQTLGKVYGFTSVTRNFNFRVFSWDSGQGADSDFQRQYSVAWDGSAAADEGADAVSLPQVGTPANRALFAIKSSTQFNYCLDLGGTATMSLNSFSGSFFSTDMAATDVMGVCYDDLNDSIIYWGGGATIGEITTSATLSAWTTAEITPVTPTGDLPTLTGFPTNATCAIAKVPDNDAYLLARGGEVYLYLRAAGATVGGGAGPVNQPIINFPWLWD